MTLNLMTYIMLLVMMTWHGQIVGAVEKGYDDDDDTGTNDDDEYDDDDYRATG